MFSGRRYPTEGTEDAGGVEEEEEEEVGVGVEGDFMEEETEGGGGGVEEEEEDVEATLAAMGLLVAGAITRCRS